MKLFYYDPIFLEHDTGFHPEHSRRIETIIAHLRQVVPGLDPTALSWEPASRQVLEAVHDRAYVDSLERACAEGGRRLDPDTVVSPKSFSAALLASGAVVDAVDRVLAGVAPTAFCLVRPPGHHATPNEAMGFCILNNVAIGARFAIQKHGLKRVLIVDWDVHHGNGTQDIFYADAQVGFFSIHRSPFYPGTGLAEETGAGAGLGSTRNVPIRYGTPRGEYHKRFAEAVRDFAEFIRPELVLISAGFDAHKLDPIGSLGLESEDFRELTRVVRGIADTYAQGRIVSTLEGGYDPQALAECVAIHLEELR